MKTNRRNFFKNVCYLLSGVLASISGFVSAALPGVSVPKTKGLSAQDICNEALSKIGKYPIDTRKPERLNFDAGDILPNLAAQVDDSKYREGCRNLSRLCNQRMSDIIISALK